MTMGFQNCDLFFDKVFTDEIEQIRGFKYFDFFRSVTNTTDVLNGFKEGRKNDKERILVYYYGLAIYDLYFASELLKRAEKLTDIDYKYCKEKYFI
jgi:ornithine cyclodeaminase/alanine dehydrogenase-like protein (mu-crystallin family)